MKRTALLLALLIASAAAAVAQYQVSKLPLADPFVFYEDGTYYAYGTHSGDGIVVFTSDNLIEWQQQSQLALHRKAMVLGSGSISGGRRICDVLFGQRTFVCRTLRIAARSFRTSGRLPDGIAYRLRKVHRLVDVPRRRRHSVYVLCTFHRR